MSIISSLEVSEKLAWSDEEHARVFDYMCKMPNFVIRQHYESFNEGLFLRQSYPQIEGKRFFEIGCATGELYRYITHYMTRLQYRGFDISAPAITRAKTKYPQADFHQLTSGFDEIRDKFEQPDVIWCRDVVLHQEEPYAFLDELISLSKELVVLRLRTRDLGETVMDSNLSCQLHWDKYWAPYIVLNTDEMIERISAHDDVNRIVVGRSYEVLGGHNYRFLPKELYFGSAGTAETAVLIHKGGRQNGTVAVDYRDGKDRRKQGLLSRITQRLILR